MEGSLPCPLSRTPSLSCLLPSWMQKVVLVPGAAQTLGTGPQGLCTRWLFPRSGQGRLPKAGHQGDGAPSSWLWWWGMRGWECLLLPSLWPGRSSRVHMGGRGEQEAWGICLAGLWGQSSRISREGRATRRKGTTQRRLPGLLGCGRRPPPGPQCSPEE